MDFEDTPLGAISAADLRSRFPLAESIALAHRGEIVADGPFNKALRLSYPARGVGPKQTGGLFIIKIPPEPEYYLSYRVKFDSGFDFRQGGKLPGLSSALCKYSGGRIPVSGDGWSARLLFLPGSAAGVYLYHFGMKGPWGDTLRLGTSLSTSRWNTLVERVRVNVGDAPNGILQVWLDGALALDRRDVQFRAGDKGLIDSLCFSTFHGGSSEAYAPRTDGHALFDDIVITRGPPPGIRPTAP